jgi:dipeptidyl aminopeptidase/acylaminoacyl peptidase
VLAAPAAAASDIAGTWSGTWTRNGDALPVEVTFRESAGGLSGAFDSDSLQVAGIPFMQVTQSGDRVHFVLKGDQSTTVFDGREAGDTIEGSLSENDIAGRFRLVRAASAPAEPAARDVTFADGPVRLAGTLLMPGTPGRHPAIVFLHGSGAEGRFANRWLAQRFARAGFVALIYDKRGVGASTGDWQSAGFSELADDAVAGVRLLQSLPEVVATKVGIYGHSQGGTIAPLVADRAGDLAFVIASAAGGTDPAATEEYSVGNSIGLRSLPPAEASDARAFVHAIVDVAYRGHSRAELDAAASRFRTRSWYFEPPPADNFYWSFARRIAPYRPAPYWRKVKAPVLLLYGASDERIPPQRDGSAIVAALHAGGNARVSLKLFAAADHNFLLPLRNGGWPKHVPGYAETLTRWAKAQVGSPGR